MENALVSTREKALKINLDPATYGSFAEIGAGQEVAALFFKAGAASGTVAKTMSAYDMTFSDAIYGKEESGRYVCEPRVKKMLDKEFSLLEKRLTGVRPADTLFFSFANTVVAINYEKTNQGHGWVGCRFQLTPGAPYNEIIMHILLHDSDTLQQQQAVGVVGVNLIYGCFYLHQDPENLINSLLDNLNPSRLEVDMIRFTGPDFAHVDNRLMSLLLVKNGLTSAALISPEGEVLQPSEAFYKRNILLMRGRFRPPTLVNMDMLKLGYDQFAGEDHVNQKNIIQIVELTLSNLKAEGEIDAKDFLDRVEILCKMGQTVLITAFHNYYRLVEYLATNSKVKMGIILGIPNLDGLFDETFYRNLKGGILESFGMIFSHNVKLYVYPTKDSATGTITTFKEFKLSEKLSPLYEFILRNGKIEGIKNAKLDNLHIFSDQVIKMIKRAEPGWEEMVPEIVAEQIKTKNLFGYKPA